MNMDQNRTHNCQDKNCNHEQIKGVKCDVENCVYHSPNCECCAGSIEVGPSHASSSLETICVTFKPQF